MGTPNWDESQHPRAPAGSTLGGQWISAGGGGSSSSSSPTKEKKAPKGELEPLVRGPWTGKEVTPERVKAMERSWKRAGYNLGTLTTLKRQVGRPGELELKPRKGKVSEHHIMFGDAFVSQLDKTKGTVLEQLKNNISATEIMFVSYEPPEAAATTSVGKGHGMFWINTNSDLAKPIKEIAAAPKDSDLWKLSSYPTRIATEQYLKDGDIDKAVKTQCELAAIHEMAHMVDAACEGNLTNSFLYAMTKGLAPEMIKGDYSKHLDEKTGEVDLTKFADWVGKNVSGYAGAMPQEAMAEAATKFINEGKLPAPLDEWATHILVGKAPKARKPEQLAA